MYICIHIYVPALCATTRKHLHRCGCGCVVGWLRAHASTHRARCTAGATRRAPSSTRSAPCCAAFALGGASTNACPASYGRVATPDACASAAAVAGKVYGGIVTLPGLPAGCLWVTLGSTIFCNTHATGAANVYAQPLCAGAAQLDTNVRACVCACMLPAADTHAPAPTHTRAQPGHNRSLFPVGAIHRPIEL